MLSHRRNEVVREFSHRRFLSFFPSLDKKPSKIFLSETVNLGSWKGKSEYEHAEHEKKNKQTSSNSLAFFFFFLEKKSFY